MYIVVLRLLKGEQPRVHVCRYVYICVEVHVHKDEFRMHVQAHLKAYMYTSMHVQFIVHVCNACRVTRTCIQAYMCICVNACVCI